MKEPKYEVTVDVDASPLNPGMRPERMSITVELTTDNPFDAVRTGLKAVTARLAGEHCREVTEKAGSMEAVRMLRDVMSRPTNIRY